MPEPPHDAAPQAEGKPCVLLVDDEPANLLALRVVLDGLDVNLVTAASGEEALGRVLEQDFAAILLDVRLPGIDGYETARLIHARGRSEHIPILFVTAHEAEDPVILQAYREGAADHLSKPLVPDVLRSKVAGFVELFRKKTEVERHRAADRIDAEKTLRGSELRFRSLIEHSFDAITLMGADGTIRYASPSVARVLGYTPDEFVGRSFFEFMHPDDIGRIADTFDALLREPGATSTGEFRYRHKDGSWRWMRGRGTNLLAVPGVEAVVGNFHDVTEEKELDAALRQRAEELAEANRLKDEFLAMLAHELRNPLAPILNSLHLMRVDQNENPLVQKARVMAERQVRNMARLVDDLLDVSRLTTGKIRLRRERVELGVVVARAAEVMRPVVEARRHDLVVLTPAEPVWMEGDPTRLEQVLTNLLNNAAKYTDPGGRIVLRLERQGGEAVLAVRDNGMGIDAKLLPRVFDLFTQGDRSMERSQGGLGIGLTVVRRLVELHGGSVVASSAGPGQGTEFLVRLPVPAATDVGERRPAPADAGAAAVPLHVLLVEDNVDAADSLAMVLLLNGHEVQIAASGPAGLEAAEASPPDVVVLDIGLPGMDGYEVARRLRSHPTLNRTPLIALSGYSSPAEKAAAEERLFDEYLVKPVDPARLQELLAGLEQTKRRGDG